MTKEEIALQLTLARLEKLQFTEHRSNENLNQNKLWNEAIADETIKLFNAIYSGIAVDTTQK